MGKFTVELPFEIGQGIWARTTVNGEAVDTLVTVEDYTINEFGVEISVSVPGKIPPESLEISSDCTPRVDARQVADQWLFETKAELGRYFVPVVGFYAPPPNKWLLFADTEIIGNIHDNQELLEGGASE